MPTAYSSMLIGGIGGMIAVFGTQFISSLKIDDVVGALPVHLIAGIWGTIAVAIFGNFEMMGVEKTWLEQLLIQLFGISENIVVWCLLITFFCSVLLIVGRYKLLDKFIKGKIEKKGIRN